MQKKGFQSKIKNRMGNVVHPDETARSHLELHCLQRYLYYGRAEKVNKVVQEMLQSQITIKIFQNNQSTDSTGWPIVPE